MVSYQIKLFVLHTILFDGLAMMRLGACLVSDCRCLTIIFHRIKLFILYWWCFASLFLLVFKEEGLQDEADAGNLLPIWLRPIQLTVIEQDPAGRTAPAQNIPPQNCSSANRWYITTVRTLLTHSHWYICIYKVLLSCLIVKYLLLNFK